MHTVTFYSYKGGVGRTLVVANVAKYLARMGMKVFVLDFDLEAPGIHYKFEVEQGKPLHVERGLVDILAEFASGKGLPEDLSRYVIEIPPPTLSTGEIHILPAGNAPSASYWKTASRVDWHTLFYSEEPVGIPLFLELKAFVAETYAPDFLLIDARTGITEMGGVATTVLSDQVVCLMLPTREHLEGTKQVMHAVRAATRGEGEREIGFVAVLSRMPVRDAEEEAREVARAKEYLNAPIDDLGSTLGIDDIAVLHRDPALEEREQLLVGSRSLEDSPLLKDYVRLFYKLVPRREVDGSIGAIIDGYNKRILDTPDKVEEALESLAQTCMHPEAYRALLRAYVVRRSPLQKRLQAATVFWELTGRANEPVLWEAVKGIANSPPGKVEPPQLQAVEAIWRAQAITDAGLASNLAAHYCDADMSDRAIQVLEANVAAAPTAAVVARLIGLLPDEENGYENAISERALEVIAQFKHEMGSDPLFAEAWAKKITESGLHQEMDALLQDPDFSLPALHKRSPALSQRLRLVQTRDPAAAATYAKAMAGNLPRSLPRAEIIQLGKLAEECSILDDFMTRLERSRPAPEVTAIRQEMERLPRLGDDIPF